DRRVGTARGLDLGDRRRDRRRTRPGGRRTPDRARLLAVDLPAPGPAPDSSPGRWIFLLQVPCAILAGIPILAVARHEAATGVIESELRQTGRPHVLANIALAMISAAIAAALFLLVLLLIEGWSLTPIGAAI